MNKKTLIPFVIALVLCIAGLAFLGVRLNQESMARKDMTTQLEATYAETARLQEEADALNISLAAETEAKEAALTEQASMQTALEEAGKSLESAQAETDAAKEALALQEAAAKEAAAARDEALEENARLTEELEAVRNALEEMQNEVSDQDSGTEPVETDDGDQAPETEASKGAVDEKELPEMTTAEIQAANDALTEELASVTSRLEEATKARESLETEKNSLTQALDSAKEETASLQTRLASAEAALQEEKDSGIALAEPVTALTGERDTLAKTNAALEAEKGTLIAENDSLTEEKAVLTAEKESLAKEKAALTAEKETLTEEKAALTAEKETLTEEKAALTEEKAALTAEKDSLTEEKAALSAEKESLSDTLAAEQEKSAGLETQISSLTSQNDEMALQLKDLQSIEELDAMLPLDMPAPRLAALEEDTMQITWTRIRYNEEGFPQLWLSIKDDIGLGSIAYIREFADEENNAQQEVYTRYPLFGQPDVVRYRTLTKPGSYAVVGFDMEGEWRNFGVLVTLEDVDGNGIIDTLTDTEDHVTLLEVENAFSVK